VGFIFSLFVAAILFVIFLVFLIFEGERGHGFSFHFFLLL
jgi:hypothetical protein